MKMSRHEIVHWGVKHHPKHKKRLQMFILTFISNFKKANQYVAEFIGTRAYNVAPYTKGDEKNAIRNLYCMYPVLLYMYTINVATF